MTSITTHGCSITAGVGIPTRGAWPNQLAHIMNISKVNNQGIPGASTKEIAYNILTTSPQHLVVILWPQFARTGFLHDEGWDQILPRHNTHYYEDYYTESDHRLQAHQHIALSYYHLKKLGCEQHHFTWEADAHQLEQPSWNPVELHPIQFDYHTMPLAEDGVHPGVQAHHKVALQMYQKISK